MLFNRKIKSTREFLFNESLLFLFCEPLQRTNPTRDHLGHYPVQSSENIGQATEQSDWLILVIGPLVAYVVLMLEPRKHCLTSLCIRSIYRTNFHFPQRFKKSISMVEGFLLEHCKTKSNEGI